VPAVAVVATLRAEANATYDNGTAVSHQGGGRRHGDRATHSIVREAREEVEEVEAQQPSS
jgi:hypothetical protein